MSNEWLRLDADQATAGSRALHEAGADLGALRTGPAAELAAASAAQPWGGDDYGRSFERQYRSVEQQVLDAWTQLAGYVSGLGQAASQSVQDNIGADIDAGHRFRRRT
nr:hypothetical protein [uncultured Actinoplanes sp.]